MMSNLKNLIALSLILIVMSTGCERNFKDEMGIPIVQFADKVMHFSSEYDEAPGPWSSFVILGEPDTYPEYGDIQTAWAPKSPNAISEYITVGFERLQYVNSIKLYETYNPGAVTEVQVHNAESAEWEIVCSGKPNLNLPKKSRIKEFSFPMTNFLVDQVKVIMETQKVEGWNEIDAIEINGVVKN